MELQLQALERHRDNLLSLPNVNGVGIGFKQRAGLETDELSVVVFVTRKLPERQLKVSSLVPQSLEGSRTDVVEVGVLTFQEWDPASWPRHPAARTELSRLDRLRPAPAGVSVGHYAVTAGTLGAVVADNQSGEWLILSNNHILANQTDGRDGRSRIGDAILQPGKKDGGTLPKDVIATLRRFIPVWLEGDSPGTTGTPRRRQPVTLFEWLLWRFWERMGWNPGQPDAPVQKEIRNLVDCAVAAPVSSGTVSPEIVGIGKVQGVAEAVPGMKVKKSGRTSGVTYGTVRAIHSSVKIQVGSRRKAVFHDQIMCTAMSQGGDSGSLVLDQNNRAVGLLFAGSRQATVCNRIRNVLEQLNVRLI